MVILYVGWDCTSVIAALKKKHHSKCYKFRAGLNIIKQEWWWSTLLPTINEYLNGRYSVKIKVKLTSARSTTDAAAIYHPLTAINLICRIKYRRYSWISAKALYLTLIRNILFHWSGKVDFRSTFVLNREPIALFHDQLKVVLCYSCIPNTPCMYKRVCQNLLYN